MLLFVLPVTQPINQSAEHNTTSIKIVIFVMMQKIVLTIKDQSKLHFFLELLKQFDFIEIQQQKRTSKDHDLFASAGLWKDRNIDSQELRAKAWKRAS